MALRALQGPTGGGAPVGGSGTSSPSTIPRWTGPSTLGDSVITQSGSVGLEAITISRASATNNALLVLSTPSGTAQQLFMRGGTAVEYFDFFRSNATGAMHVQGNQAGFNNICLAPTSGNVGIGTASPVSRLDVAGTITCDDAGTGLKLPATPGNADTQTLDCYQEGTWTPTLTGFGGTTPTINSARFTRIGRVVSLQVFIQATGGASYSSTATATYISLPSGMTASTSAPGATSNSGIGADGPCVAYNNGNLYLPTFAARTFDMFLNVTYTV